MAEKEKVQQFSPGEMTPFGVAPPPPPPSPGADIEIHPNQVTPSNRPRGTLMIRKKHETPPKITFGDFLDLFALSRPTLPAKEPSEDTVDIPRQFPPPVYGYYSDVNGTPPKEYKAFVRSPSEKYKRPHGLDGKSYSTESDEMPRRYERPSDERAKETRIRIHWCTKCGRWRSRRYHRANPLMPGRKPTMGVCRRCMSPETSIDREKRSKKETEEILVHRIKAPRSWFRRSSRDSIRITSERSTDQSTDSPKVPSPRTNIRRQERSSSSEKDKAPRYRIIRRVIVRPRRISPPVKQSLPEGYESDERIAFRRLHTVRGAAASQPNTVREGHRRRSSSSSSGEHAYQRLRTNGQKINSYPSTCNRSQDIPQHLNSERWVCYKEVRPPGQNHTPPRPPSPPEWYYRRTYVAPSVIESRETRRLDRERDFYERTAASKGDGYPSSRPAHLDLCRARQDDDRKQRVRDDDDDEMVEKTSRQVRFEPKATNLRQQRMHREALQDKMEARRDQHEFEEHKHQIRRGVAKGGGQFELDGHNSEDVRRSESTPCIDESYKHVIAPSPRRGFSKGTTHPPLSEDTGSTGSGPDDVLGSRSEFLRISAGRTNSYPSHSTPSRSLAKTRCTSSDSKSSGGSTERWTAPSLFPQDRPTQRPEFFARARSTDVSIFSNSSASGSRNASLESRPSDTPSPKSQEELLNSPKTFSVQTGDGRSATTQELNDVYKKSIGSRASSSTGSVARSSESCDGHSSEYRDPSASFRKISKDEPDSRHSKASKSDNVAPEEQQTWDDFTTAWRAPEDADGGKSGPSW